MAEVVAVLGAWDAEGDRRDQAAPREENGAGHPEAEVFQGAAAFRGAEAFPEAAAFPEAEASPGGLAGAGRLVGEKKSPWGPAPR